MESFETTCLVVKSATDVNQFASCAQIINQSPVGSRSPAWLHSLSSPQRIVPPNADSQHSGSIRVPEAYPVSAELPVRINSQSGTNIYCSTKAVISPRLRSTAGDVSSNAHMDCSDVVQSVPRCTVTVVSMLQSAITNFSSCIVPSNVLSSVRATCSTEAKDCALTESTSRMSTVNGSMSAEPGLMQLDGCSNGTLFETDAGQLSTELTDDSDSESIVIIDADLPAPILKMHIPKRSVAAENVILFNHHNVLEPSVSCSSETTNCILEPSPSIISEPMNCTQTGRVQRKRKAELSTRSIECCSTGNEVIYDSPCRGRRRKLNTVKKDKTTAPRQRRRRTKAVSSVGAVNNCFDSSNPQPQSVGRVSTGKTVNRVQQVAKVSAALSPSNCQNLDEKRSKLNVEAQNEEIPVLVPIARAKRARVTCRAQKLPGTVNVCHVKAKQTKTSEALHGSADPIQTSAINTIPNCDENFQKLLRKLTLPASQSVVHPSDVTSVNIVSIDEQSVAACQQRQEPEISDFSRDPKSRSGENKSVELKITNEDGVVENVIVTVIDISSSEEEDDDDVEEEEDTSHIDQRSSCVQALNVSTNVKHLPVESSPIKSAQAATPVLPPVVSSRPLPALRDSRLTVAGVAQNRPLPVLTDSRQLKSAVENVAAGTGEAKCSSPTQTSSAPASKRRPQKNRKFLPRHSSRRKGLLKRGKKMSSADNSKLSFEDRDTSQQVNRLKKLYGAGSSHKQSKHSSASKQHKTELESAYSGPVIRVRGPREQPSSCTVIAAPLDANSESIGKLKRKSMAFSSSCYPTSFHLLDSEPWSCVFCHCGSSYRTLGDLFGPYSLNSSEVSGGATSPQKKPDESPKGTNLSTSRNRTNKTTKSSPGTSVQSSSKATTVPQEIWVHEDCIIWTPNTYISNSGILEGLDAAVSAAANAYCVICHKNGATLGCFVKGCSQTYHYLCAVNAGCCLCEENFCMFCVKHKNNKAKIQTQSHSS